MDDNQARLALLMRKAENIIGAKKNMSMIKNKIDNGVEKSRVKRKGYANYGG